MASPVSVAGMYTTVLLHVCHLIVRFGVLTSAAAADAACNRTSPPLDMRRCMRDFPAGWLSSKKHRLIVIFLRSVHPMGGSEAEIFTIAILWVNNVFWNFGEEFLLHFRGEEILINERWVTFLGGNVFRNLESMTKKGNQKFWWIKRHIIREIYIFREEEGKT